MKEASAAPAKRIRWGWVVFVLLVLALIVLMVVHLLRSKPAKQGTPAQVVTVSAAQLGDMPETLDALGTVTPYATVTVLPQLSGYLTQVAYREGQDVQKGQLIAQIDPRQYQITKQSAQAQLAKDQATLDQACSDLARYAQLNEQKSIAAQTYTDQQFAVQQAEAAVKADRATIAQADLDLDYCRITSPVTGRVGLRLVDVGNYVTASSTTGIAVITQMSPTSVEFSIPQNALGNVLQRFNAQGGKLPVTAYASDTGPTGKPIATGELYAINNQMATSTGTVTLRANFENADERLFPNEFVNVKLLVDTLHDAVLVPAPAVQSGAPGNYVYLVNAAGNTVSVHKVTIGPSDGKKTVILTGLAQGDKVVTDGMDRLSDGARIRGVPPRAASGAAAGGAGDASGAAGTAAGASGAHAHHGAHAHGAASGASAGQAAAAS